MPPQINLANLSEYENTRVELCGDFVVEIKGRRLETLDARQKTRQKVEEHPKTQQTQAPLPLTFGPRTEGQNHETPVSTGVFERAREDSNL